MAKQMFEVYQKMMLSIETVFLAFELLESYEFRDLIEKKLEKHKLL
jgi:hypothetical protein